MASFAGFRDGKDYLTRRCRDRGISMTALSEAIGASHGYAHAVANKVFDISRDMADAIANYFGDNPKIVRILFDLELPPTEEDQDISEIKEIGVSLNKKGRKELLKYAHYLKDQENDSEYKTGKS